MKRSGTVLLLVTATTAAAFGSDMSFQKYPAGAVYRGQLHYPQFSGRDKTYRMYSTRLREGMKRGANFAGKYAIVEVGCGAGCRFPLLIDISTGNVSELPIGGEDFPMLETKYQTDSRLLVAQWQDEKTESCMQEQLVWNGASFDQSAPENIGGYKDACSQP
jgi:hypothetical protein